MSLNKLSKNLQYLSLLLYRLVILEIFFLLNRQEESVRPTLSKRQWDTESLLDDFCSRHHAATFVSLKFTRPLCTPAYRSCVLFCLKLQENVTSCLDTCTHRRQTLTPLLKGQDNKRMSSPVTDCGTANCHHLRNTDNYGDCLISVCLRER